MASCRHEQEIAIGRSRAGHTCGRDGRWCGRPGDGGVRGQRAWCCGYLLAPASAPALALGPDFSRIQKYYAVFGAFFVPFLAVALLYLNGRSRWLGVYRNGMITNLLLLAVLAFFAYVLVSGAAQQTGG